MTGQFAATADHGTVPVRNGSAEPTTIRLMALLRITASSGENINIPIRSGSRNSAPPSPIRPPNIPIAVPARNPLPYDDVIMLCIGLFPFTKKISFHFAANTEISSH
jgi:hypothetical protein